VDVAAPEGSIAVQLGQLQLLVGLDEAVIVGPGPDPRACELAGDPEAVRQHVRLDDEGRYRPLSGLRNLRSNWHARFTTLESFGAAVDAIYPLGQRHAALHAEGRLTVTTLDELFARQEGRYAVAADLSARGRELALGILCGSCVRVPLWTGAQVVSEGGIPCPEPCSLLLALCREAALWEREPPAITANDAQVPLGAFETPGNPIRETYIRAMESRSG
jgi:hypothetical protein